MKIKKYLFITISIFLILFFFWTKQPISNIDTLKYMISNGNILKVIKYSFQKEQYKSEDLNELSSIKKQYLMKASYEEGNSAGAFALASLFFTEKNEELAVKWFTIANEFGHPQAYIKLIELYENNPKLDVTEYDLIPLYKKKFLNKESADISFKLAKMYESIAPSEGTLLTAYAWYEKSAELGLAEAQYQTGLNYLSNITDDFDKPNPRVVFKANSKKAFYWFSKAADQGHSAAYLELAKIYEKSNPSAAFKIYLHEAEKGNTEYYKQVSDMYSQGIGTEENILRAIFWIEKLANTGDSDAAYSTGLLYYKVFQDVSFNFALNDKSSNDVIEKGIFWLEKVANENNQQSIEKLIEIYSSIWFLRNDQKASYWRSKWDKGLKRNDTAPYG